MRLFIKNLFLGSMFCVSGLLAESSVENRVEDFEYFWNAYKRSYVFFDLKKADYGVDWDSIRDSFLKRVSETQNDRELFALITEAQTLLRDGHCYNQAVDLLLKTEPMYLLQMQFAVVEGNRVAVAKLHPESEAAQAGVKVGDELVQFGGKTIRQLARESRTLFAGSTESQFWNSMVGSLFYHNPLLGKPKSPKINMVFRNSSGETINVDSRWLVIQPAQTQNSVSSFVDEGRGILLSDAQRIEAEGALPMDVRVFTEENVGYIKIDTWMKHEDPKEQFEMAMTAVKDTDGLVLDMRGNGGGVSTWGVLFANYFIAGSKEHPNQTVLERLLSETFFKVVFSGMKKEDLEPLLSSAEGIHALLTQGLKEEIDLEEVQSHFKSGEYREFYRVFGLNDRTNAVETYTKPVYILMDGGSYSTTDIFITLMKEFGRATTVGVHNGAGSGSPIPFVLPNSGLSVYVPHGRFFPPSGSMIEGRPLEPDIRVSQSSEDLAIGKDTALTVALKALWEEINPSMSGYSDSGFETGSSEVKYSTIVSDETPWTRIPQPDWLIQSNLEAQMFQDTKINLNQ